MMRLLLLEDDLQLGRALYTALSKTEFEAVWVRRVADACQQLEREDYTIALLDIGLPDGSGMEVLAWLRGGGGRNGKHLPVMLLTARDAVEDRVRGLDQGADDYLPKPFAVAELLSRIRALARRSAGQAQRIWQVGDLCIDPARHHVAVGDSVVDLSLREFKLLLALVQAAGRYVTRTQLEAIGGSESAADGNSLEVHIHHLRKKIGAERIKTIRGVGYLLVSDA